MNSLISQAGQAVGPAWLFPDSATRRPRLICERWQNDAPLSTTLKLRRPHSHSQTSEEDADLSSIIHINMSQSSFDVAEIKLGEINNPSKHTHTHTTHTHTPHTTHHTHTHTPHTHTHHTHTHACAYHSGHSSSLGVLTKHGKGAPPACKGHHGTPVQSQTRNLEGAPNRKNAQQHLSKLVQF